MATALNCAPASSSKERSDGPSDNILSKYRGCLMGALAGDCIGYIFEVPRSPPKFVEVSKIEKAVRDQHDKKDRLQYTDDTAMCHALAESLVRCGRLDVRDVAESFTNKFYAEKKKQRMYARVKAVFAAWKKSNYVGDLFGPSKAQFDGMGSMGNGGGMRIAGVPLFCGDRLEDIIEIAKVSTQLTHYNVLGYNGAILQAYAVFLALHSETPDAGAFIDKLIKFSRDHLEKSEQEKPYTKQLLTAKTLLSSDTAVQKDAIEKLGHSVKALDAIPMAIFCAARALRPIPGIENPDPFERAIIYAISMGGDTDTIATMAGAISGAWFGIEHVPADWQRFCEAADKTMTLADSLYKHAYGSKKPDIPLHFEVSPAKKQKVEGNT
ncbi:ADP-ribosylhydrolase ARH3-like isoform X2 [Paramacrobiotus metropolitanus]|nr:ADP-ribosylhydrolase ARH3-like isoform X2 [Paramacrobiotus metropolitanus]XP_055332730.1 ADP-ribosylhydrolase ARH3-like isoform X2 [Paramacrobiotus metropolitanus]XP_055332731.1 ADP-ribosylhydrolase ARH3-like isoform X2 [Paramacrobiotus metropolitanus]